MGILKDIYHDIEYAHAKKQRMKEREKEKKQQAEKARKDRVKQSKIRANGGILLTSQLLSFEKEDYKTMKQKFKDAGFLFVFCNGVTPLIPFFHPEKGTVKRILISGDHRPELGRYYKKTARITIEYYM